MRKIRSFLVAALVALAVPSFAVPPAGSPMILQTAGRLLDGQDVPVNGPTKLTFSIYAVGDDLPGHSATPPVWTATYDVVVQNGVYTVALGDTANGGTALTSGVFDVSEERWLGVSVNNGTELRPRLRVGTVPLAAIASTALDAQKLGGELPATYHDAALLTGQVPAASLDNALQAIATSGPLTAEKVGTQVTLGIGTADGTQAGALSAADWLRFDTGAQVAATAKATADAGKATAEQAKATASTALQALTATAPLVTQRTGNDVSLGLAKATVSTDGYLSAADYVSLTTGAIADSRLSTNIVRQGGTASFSNLTVTGSNGITLPDASIAASKLGKSGCAPGQILRRNAADTAWQCDDLPAAGPWTRVSYDDFESGAPGWSDQTRSQCGSLGTHLGNFGAGKEVSKTITGLPAHKTVRVVARYHMIDTWDFERGYLKVDGAEAWAKSAYFLHGGYDVCGVPGGYPDRVNVPVEVELQHTGSSVTITFGSTLDQANNDESFGVDDVAVYVSDTEPGWKLAARETFDGTVAGWSNNSTYTCSNGKLLGGYGNFGGGYVQKVFDLNGSPHSEVRIRAEYFPLDSWDGESAYMNADGQMDTSTDSYGTRVWTVSNVRCFGKVNACGNTGYPDCEPFQIDTTLPSQQRYLRLMFGSTLDEPTTNESWGIKNLEIWVR